MCNNRVVLRGNLSERFFLMSAHPNHIETTLETKASVSRVWRALTDHFAGHLDANP